MDFDLKKIEEEKGREGVNAFLSEISKCEGFIRMSPIKNLSSPKWDERLDKRQAKLDACLSHSSKAVATAEMVLQEVL